MEKKYITSIVLILLIALILSASVMAEEEKDHELEERMKLIQASQELMKKQNTPPSARFALFLTDFGAGNNEANLGLKVEKNIPGKLIGPDFDLYYVLEGIHIKGEGKTAAFFSIKNIWNKSLSPYYGCGLELTGEANYQLFAGVILANNFYLESKYINEEGEFKYSTFYSAAGFQLNF